MRLDGDAAAAAAHRASGNATQVDLQAGWNVLVTLMSNKALLCCRIVALIAKAFLQSAVICVLQGVSGTLHYTELQTTMQARHEVHQDIRTIDK